MRRGKFVSEETDKEMNVINMIDESIVFIMDVQLGRCDFGGDRVTKAWLQTLWVQLLRVRDDTREVADTFFL